MQDSKRRSEVTNDRTLEIERCQPSSRSRRRRTSLSISMGRKLQKILARQTEGRRSRRAMPQRQSLQTRTGNSGL